ncbi:MAG: flagellar brake protein [Bacillota bacterium]
MLCVRQNILVAKKGKKEWYSSVVLDVEDTEVLIAFPMLNGEPLYIEGNEALEITFSNEGARYLFESGFTRRIGEALVIERPRLLEKTELRRYPRVAVNIDLYYNEISCRSDSGPEHKKGRILDISGNGIRFSVGQLYTPSTYMSVGFNVPLKERIVPIKVECRVVRIIVNDDTEPVEYQLGAEFSRIDKEDQDYIVSYVYNKIKEMNKQQV